MGQRAMCYHLFLCPLFYHSSYCCFPPLHVFYHRLGFCSTSLSLLITTVNRLPPAEPECFIPSETAILL